MSKLSIPALKKQLKTYKTEELVSIIVDCYRSNPEVKKYIHMLLEPENTEDQLFEEAKKKIVQQFYPDRGYPKLKLAEAKKAISEFGKLSGNQARTIELMIHYVELGVRFTNDYGDINEPFYNSIASTYHNALKKINQDTNEGLLHLFKERLSAIVTDTSHIGWGFHDELAGSYYTYVVDDEED
ncbi:hypothetical protein A8990_106137 [Paenibacillus taihuensis]|uniref:Uncharacterized protein n=1 Tax=Paenibacillus taihuensis TaxID=1156355 RepID=A0A3D9SKW7_9BACL|nr:DUF6155 family protein [Paenibacillus taihuensis]REE90632.1 hypothetical protein A8990_106137 [Paenibacillus taihuensis]